MSSSDSPFSEQNHPPSSERQMLIARIEQEVKARHQLSKQILANEEDYERQRRLLERHQQDQESRIDHYTLQLSRALQEVEYQEGYVQEERSFRQAIESRTAELLSKSFEEANGTLSPQQVLQYLNLNTGVADPQEPCDSDALNAGQPTQGHLVAGKLPEMSTPNAQCYHLCQQVEWCPACGPPRAIFNSINDKEDYFMPPQPQSECTQRLVWQQERMKMLLEANIAKEANQVALDGLNQQVVSLHGQLAQSKEEIWRLRGQLEASQIPIQAPRNVDTESRAEIEELKRQVKSLTGEKNLLQLVYAQHQEELAQLQQLHMIKTQLLDSLDGLQNLMQSTRTFERRVHKALDELSAKCDRALILFSANGLWNKEQDEVRQCSWKLCVFKDAVVTGMAPSRMELGFDDEGSQTYDVEMRLAALSFASFATRSILASPVALELYKEWTRFVQKHILQVCSLKAPDIHEHSPLSKEVFTQVIKGGFAALFEQCPGLLLEVTKLNADAENAELDAAIGSLKQSILWQPIRRAAYLKKPSSLNWKMTCAVGGFANKADQPS
eukprot:GEMP01026417.1.p1 GENE.GEMP01026417.1~~GEMP01026417.1.p1  ORF type:complete len:564 (+),score=122.03 GEMP01026417.1:29-1693(+)